MLDPVLGESMMRWTVRLAVVLYLARLWILVGKCSKATIPPSRLECCLWTGALAAYLIHVLLAFHVVHNWSHRQAWLHTAAETQRMTGIYRGDGVWVNYVFTLLWSADAVRLWIARRRDKVTAYGPKLLWHAFIAFIVFNATVIFGPPMYRWLVVPVGIVFTVRAVYACRLAKSNDSKN